MDQDLLSKIKNGLARDRHLGVGQRLRKGLRLVSESTWARILLRSCDALGPGARVAGLMRVQNRGVLVVGNGLVVNSTFVPTEILTGTDGKIEVGDGVWINFGTVVAARRSVKIGHRVMIGQHCIVSDVENPEGVLADGSNGAMPIEIGDDVWLAGRVTVMPGVRIGEGAVITAGSVVESDVPPRVVAGGIPARVLRAVAEDEPANGPSSKNGMPGATPSVEAPQRPAVTPSISGTLISDFTIDELADELRSAEVYPAIGAEVAPFGQVVQVLLQEPSLSAADFAVVWTRAETALPAFARTIAFGDVSDEELLADVDAFCKLIEGAVPRYRFIFVPTFTLPPWMRGLGMIDTRKGGYARALLLVNMRLADNLARLSNVFVLSAERWFQAGGRAAVNPKGWYLGKMAIPRAVMAEAAVDIKSAIGGLSGGARKLLVLDLDETLWGGIVGDVGWEGLRLGGHDGVGEAYADFQRAIKNLKRRGIVLAIASKNEESVALEAIRRHPAMVLAEDDFVGWKINWNDKARNISELAAELNLGLQSVVFIDDNPVERARVREALPEVFVPEWPADPLLYPSTLQRLRCFDVPAVSREDLDRTRMYAEERKREELQKNVGSIAEWLQSLKIKVRVEPLSPSNLTRAAQLLNKTNQLNLTTRRLTDAELLEWSRGQGRAFFTVSVSDRFGDAGLTGLVSIEREGDSARIVDYVLSCRVMGRKVEETMVHVAVKAAAGQSASTVVAHYIPTPKNKPCLSFWQNSGFANGDGQRFTWDARQQYPLPEPITLEWQPLV